MYMHMSAMINLLDSNNVYYNNVYFCFMKNMWFIFGFLLQPMLAVSWAYFVELVWLQL